ncbi:MAG: ABC-type transport auxiliary lipoprotein family protein [Alphaproteobacteria bacterium]
MKKYIASILAGLLSAGFAGCSLLPEPPAPSERILIDPDPLPTPLPARGKKRSMWVWVEDPQTESFLETSNVLLRPTPHTLGSYEGVVWVSPPGTMLKKVLVKSLVASKGFEGVTETFQNTSLPLAKVSIILDGFWIDHTLGGGAQARIKGTLRLERDFSSATNKQVVQVFDIKVPVRGSGKQAIFQAIEEAVKQWAQNAATWIYQM